MAVSSARTVDEYLNQLPSGRKETIEVLRGVILENLPEGYVERMQHGMIGYVVPLETYPATYNGQHLVFAALASQKNYMSLYFMGVYGDAATQQWFVERYKAGGKKLNMGKSCVRFKNLGDLPLELVGEAIARTPVADFIALYESSRRQR